MSKRSAGVISLFFFVLVAVTPGGAAEERILHDTISILSGADFTAENGVVAGCGSIDDPYVIAGWVIDAQADVGIRIQGTSAHVLICDCHIIGDRQRGIGILLGEASSIRVHECSLVNLETGVFIYRNTDASVEGSAFTGCRCAIEATESDEVDLTKNSVVRAVKHGLFLWRCHGASIHGNVLSNCRNGIYLDSCHRDYLYGNRIERMDRGIFLWDCFDCTIVGNVLRSCDLGLALVHTSAQNTVFNNAFFDNARPATCDEAENQWDGGYPIGGNFWGEEGSVDKHSGPGQDQPGSDGISDVVRSIPFENVDRYPLVSPPKIDETE